MRGYNMADDTGKTVFVTVGTTSFDGLIKRVMTIDVIEVLKKRGYRHLVLQIGRGNYVPDMKEDVEFSISHFRYKDSITEDIKQADLVISHAGAGSVLETLGADRPLVVVINEGLMNNHQVELAYQLYQDKHLFYCNCHTLADTLEEMDLSKLKNYESGQPQRFSSFLDQVMGIS